LPPPEPPEETFLGAIEAHARMPTKLGSSTGRTEAYANQCELRSNETHDFKLRNFVVRRSTLRIDVAGLSFGLLLMCWMAGMIHGAVVTAAAAFAPAIIAPSFRNIATAMTVTTSRDR
jgi:hypothetical protein